MTTKTGGLSLASLDATAASSKPFEFEYLDAANRPTGIFLSVLGGEAAEVIAHSRKVTNEERRKAAAQAATVTFIPGDAGYRPIEEDVEAIQRAAAVRLVGWRQPGDTKGLDEEQVKRFEGIVEPYSPGLALQLIKSNAHLMGQVLARSNALGNFMPGLSKA